MANKLNDFSVKFGKTARTLEYNDPEGHLTFTFDQGSRDKSLCLEHFPARKQIAPRYGIAFERAKEFLQSKGYKVEMYGDFATSEWIEAKDIKIIIERELASLTRPLKSHLDLS